MDDAKFVQAFQIGLNNTPFIDGEIADVYGIKFVEVQREHLKSLPVPVLQVLTYMRTLYSVKKHTVLRKSPEKATLRLS
jgi:hypothetical protein